jgi:hypothetical protein
MFFRVVQSKGSPYRRLDQSRVRGCLPFSKNAVSRKSPGHCVMDDEIGDLLSAFNLALRGMGKQILSLGHGFSFGQIAAC